VCFHEAGYRQEAHKYVDGNGDTVSPTLSRLTTPVESDRYTVFRHSERRSTRANDRT
jgi:hypothetical protein